MSLLKLRGFKADEQTEVNGYKRTGTKRDMNYDGSTRAVMDR